MITTIINSLKNLGQNRYYVVYKNKEDKIKTYLIGDINLYNSFSNKEQGRDNAGFKAYCFVAETGQIF